MDKKGYTESVLIDRVERMGKSVPMYCPTKNGLCSNGCNGSVEGMAPIGSGGKVCLSVSVEGSAVVRWLRGMFVRSGELFHFCPFVRARVGQGRVV